MASTAAINFQRGSVHLLAAPKKRELSAAGRKVIIEATRKRWAAVRKAAAKKTKAVTKAPAQKAATAAS
jgi:hypothetical protein